MDGATFTDGSIYEFDRLLADLPEVGPWSEIKGQIITKYASSFTTILANQTWAHTAYIDMFAGSPVNELRGRSELVPGSSLQALSVYPPFDSHLFIDINSVRISALEHIQEKNKRVKVFHGDGNRIMIEKVLPRIKANSRVRALVIIDPYGINLDWKVVEGLGQCRHVDIILNFPIMDMLRNALRKKLDERSKWAIDRMNLWWGDDTWQSIFYAESPYGTTDLFGNPIAQERKGDSDAIVAAYCSRLREVAKFGYVADPIGIKNSKNSNLYYLVFASPKAVGAKIMNDITKSYR